MFSILLVGKKEKREVGKRRKNLGAGSLRGLKTGSEMDTAYGHQSKLLYLKRGKEKSYEDGQ